MKVYVVLYCQPEETDVVTICSTYAWAARRAVGIEKEKLTEYLKRDFFIHGQTQKDRVDSFHAMRSVRVEEFELETEELT